MPTRPTPHRIARRGMAVAVYTAVLVALGAALLTGGSKGAPPTVRLTVERAGAGTVHGVLCPVRGGACTATVPKGTTLTLTADAARGSRFRGWGGSCTGRDVCRLTLRTDRSVTATFVHHRHHALARHHHTRPVRPPPPPSLPPPPVELMIDHQGAGHGTVTVLGGARCSGDCTLTITRGRVLTLTAVAPAGARFAGWTAPVACRGKTTCDVQVRAAMTVAARFSAVAPPPQRFTLTLRATGPGAVDLCHGARACSRTYLAGTRVAVAARPFAHGAFRRWHGCRAHGVTCRVAITRDRTLTARFRHRDPARGKQTWQAPDRGKPPALAGEPTHALDVRTTPGGAVQVGTVRCQGVAPCRHEFAHGTLVTLVAEPDPGAAFVRWAACPDATGDTCRIVLTGDRAVMAIFSSPAASALDPPA